MPYAEKRQKVFFPQYKHELNMRIFINPPSCGYAVLSDSAIPWTVASQAHLSMELFRQEYWSGLPFPFPGDLSQGLNLPSWSKLFWLEVTKPKHIRKRVEMGLENNLISGLKLCHS